jgi:hypothetical protein
VLAVADEQVLIHPAGHGKPLLIGSLSGGAFLFIGGTMAFKRLTSGQGGGRCRTLSASPCLRCTGSGRSRSIQSHCSCTRLRRRCSLSSPSGNGLIRRALGAFSESVAQDPMRSSFLAARLSGQEADGSRDFCTLPSNLPETRELARISSVPPVVCCTTRAACSTLWPYKPCLPAQLSFVEPRSTQRCESIGDALGRRPGS